MYVCMCDISNLRVEKKQS